jgi:RNA polymerase sigma-70 factor (ECF subfamily)
MANSFADELVVCMPRLTNFARRLTHNRSAAEDLVQETMLRALNHADQFEPGTNLAAWLSVILRNCYFNDKRTDSRLISSDAIEALSTAIIDCPQESHLRLAEADCRFNTLPVAQRQALLLVGANGNSYELAAKTAGCAVGTMKSRVSRARTELQNLLNAPVSKRPTVSHQADYDHLGRAA